MKADAQKSSRAIKVKVNADVTQKKLFAKMHLRKSYLAL